MKVLGTLWRTFKPGASPTFEEIVEEMGAYLIPPESVGSKWERFVDRLDVRVLYEKWKAAQ